MSFWSQTEDGWAVNLDGSNAALEFRLPRIELRSGPRGWSCACHLPNGTSRLVPLGHPASIAAAMRAGLEGSRASVGPEYHAGIQALLEAAERR